MQPRSYFAITFRASHWFSFRHHCNLISRLNFLRLFDSCGMIINLNNAIYQSGNQFTIYIRFCFHFSLILKTVLYNCFHLQLNIFSLKLIFCYQKLSTSSNIYVSVFALRAHNYFLFTETFLRFVTQIDMHL